MLADYLRRSVEERKLPKQMERFDRYFDNINWNIQMKHVPFHLHTFPLVPGLAPILIRVQGLAT